jgi:hypothetical protein
VEPGLVANVQMFLRHSKCIVQHCAGQVLDIILKGKVNDSKRVARCKVDAMLKKWAKTQTSRPNTDLR